MIIIESSTQPDQRLDQYKDILAVLNGVEDGEAGLYLSKSGKTLALSIAHTSRGEMPLSARWVEAYEAIENHGFAVRNMVEEHGVLQIVARKISGVART